MEAKKYCVFNKTTERFLSAGVTGLCTTNEPLEALKMMVDAEDLNVESGLWLTPFKGIPVARIFSPVDLVYLDEDYQVVQAVELSPGVPLTPFEGQAASALVLPLHTVYSSRTHPGDQLIICAAEELVRQLARVSTSAPAPVAQRAESSVRKSLPGSGSGQSQANRQPVPRTETDSPMPVFHRADSPSLESPRGKEERAARPAGALIAPKEGQGRAPVQKAANEPQSREIDSVISQVLGWAEKTDRVLTPASPSPVPAPFAEKKGPPAEVRGDTAAAAPPNPEIEGIADAWTEQETEVISQTARWVEDTKPRLAPATVAATPDPAAQGSDSNSRRLRQRSGDVSAAPEARAVATQAAAQPLKSDATDLPSSEKKESLKIRLQRVAEQIEEPLRTVPTAATAPATDGQNTESGSQKTQAQWANGSSAPGGAPRQAPAQGLERAEPPAKERVTLQNRFMRWLYPEQETGPVDRRRSSRQPAPGLVAYYYTGGAPKPHKVGDISGTGFYLLTDERWLPDTMIRMTLQRADSGGENPEDSISVVSKVVRCGTDGVGSEFILSESTHPKSHQLSSGKEINRETLERFLHS
jgi:hypothetical protein